MSPPGALDVGGGCFRGKRMGWGMLAGKQQVGYRVVATARHMRADFLTPILPLRGCGGTLTLLYQHQPHQKFMHLCSVLHFGGMAAFEGRQGMAQHAATDPIREAGRHGPFSVYSMH